MPQLPKSPRAPQPQKAVPWGTRGSWLPLLCPVTSVPCRTCVSEGMALSFPLTHGTFGEELCLAEHWSFLWAPHSSCVGTATMATPLMVLAGGGKEDHGKRDEKKGCRMRKGAERQREVQSGIMGWEGQIEWPPPLLCVRKSMRATNEGKHYTQTTSPAGYKL